MAEACRASRPPGDRGQRQPLQRERRRRHRPHAGARRPGSGRRACARRPPGLAWSAGDTARPARPPRRRGRSRWTARAGRPSGAGHRGGAVPAARPRRARGGLRLRGRRWWPRRSAASRARCSGVHDVSAGGLAVALAEMAAAAGLGCVVDARPTPAELFTELPLPLRRRQDDAERCAPGPRRPASRQPCSAGPAATRFTLGDLVDLPVDGVAGGLRGEPGQAAGRTVTARACARMGSGEGSCGVFGVYAPGPRVAHLTFDGLFALQHRGQESAGHGGERRRHRHGRQGHGPGRHRLRRAHPLGAAGPSGHRPHPLLDPRRLGLGRRPAGLPAGRAGPASRSGTTAT